MTKPEVSKEDLTDIPSLKKIVRKLIDVKNWDKDLTYTLEKGSDPLLKEYIQGL